MNKKNLLALAALIILSQNISYGRGPKLRDQIQEKETPFLSQSIPVGKSYKERKKRKKEEKTRYMVIDFLKFKIKQLEKYGERVESNHKEYAESYDHLGGFKKNPALELKMMDSELEAKMINRELEAMTITLEYLGGSRLFTWAKL